MISVVIVNYNAGLLLAECVYSALPFVSEVLIVDNASSDASIAQCARQFADEPRFRVIQNDANLGFSAACNIGFSQASGDLVLFLNPDCRLDEAAIREMRRVLQADATVGQVGQVGHGGWFVGFGARRWSPCGAYALALIGARAWIKSLRQPLAQAVL